MTFRYIGSKARVVEAIAKRIGPPSGRGRFVDLFCGTGVVAEAAATLGWDVHLNDHLQSSVVMAAARLITPAQAKFAKLEHARTTTGASLLIIDEINRGPAVQVFGGAIVAIEPEKRLGTDGSPQHGTQYFELLDPASGEMIEYAFPHHLYILAALNQADVSVEPLDVAFLRRWTAYPLGPDEAVLRTYFGLSPEARLVPNSPANAQDVYEAVVQAWAKVNDRIALGRAREFQIGHGVVMGPSGTAPSDLEGALALVVRSWSAIRTHLDEVFFGDMRGLAVALNAAGQSAKHPYSLQEVFFGDEPKQQLAGPARVTADNVFAVLAAVAE